MIDTTSRVGKFSPQGDSPYGCADMAGNVWEWCSDWFNRNEYKQRHILTVKDPQGPKDGQSRVMRGGSWSYYNWAARISFRGENPPTDKDSHFGFRVASSLPK